MSTGLIRSLTPLLKMLPKRSDFVRKPAVGAGGYRWVVNGGARATWFTVAGSNVRWTNT